MRSSRGSSVLAAAALALVAMPNRYGMSAQAHFPSGIDDGSRLRPARQPHNLPESPAYGRFGTNGLSPDEATAAAEHGRKAAQRSNIDAWNKEVERKKAEKRAAKAAKTFL